MKLRNKPEYIGEEKPKGRVGTLIGYSDSHKAIVVEFEGEDGGTITSLYRSLAELNDDWEDYKPKEPLIKDEKIRKVVRAWAYINSVKTATYDEFHHDRGLNVFFFEDDEKENAVIQFYGWIPTLKEGEDYTITELCGEEEECVS